ncbi:MAG: hypothetical protein KGI57_08660 [Hyphomicrobiales bacterium]|nr:hypothetical protein [Hyphomicrobiales bacterium]MDE2017763.1 hypothetical protein [Hyphomicrobiales bacterium]
MAGFLYPDAPWAAFGFVLFTLILGGGGAYASGRAVALTWRPAWQVVVSALLLALAARFLHFALLDEYLTSLHYYAVAAVILTALAFAGFRVTRAAQMKAKYPWLFGAAKA